MPSRKLVTLCGILIPCYFLLTQWHVSHTALQRLGARLGADSMMEPVKITTAKTAMAKSST